MSLSITTTAQAKEYLDLHVKLKEIEASNVDVYVDLRNKEIRFKASREFPTTLADALVILEKSLFIWIRDLDATYTAVSSLNLSFSDAELVNF